MIDVGTVAPFEDRDGFGVVGMFTECLEYLGPAMAFGLCQQRNGAVEADGQDVFVVAERPVIAVMANIGAETADAGADFFRRFWVLADFAGQRKEPRGFLKFQFVRIGALGNRDALWFGVAFRFAALNVEPIGAFADGDRFVRRWIDAKFAGANGTATVAVAGVAQCAGELAFGVI